tara:strand:+ start:9866 stop:10087 length:222 start_codon:yes stop_codon:yes gene_type:complete
MAERVEVTGVDVENEAITVTLNPDDGGLVLLHHDDCLIFWHAFKGHTFRHDDVAGEKAWQIFLKIAKASGEYV